MPLAFYPSVAFVDPFFSPKTRPFCIEDRMPRFVWAECVPVLTYTGWFPAKTALFDKFSMLFCWIVSCYFFTLLCILRYDLSSFNPVKVYVKVQPYLRTSRHKQIRIGAFQRGNISQLWSRGFKVTSLKCWQSRKKWDTLDWRLHFSQVLETSITYLLDFVRSMVLQNF